MSKPVPLTLEQKAQKQLDEFVASQEPLHDLAERAYEAQDSETQEALDLIVERIMTISSGLVRLKVEYRKKIQPVTLQLTQSQMRKNALYMATEILKDLALFDVRVANYKFPPGVCAVCGKKLKSKIKAKAKAKKG